MADDALAQATAKAMGLSERKMRVAVRYYAAYRAEVDERIAANRDAAAEVEAAWQAEQDLLLDEMYPPALVDLLCQYGHDVVAVAARADLVGLDDPAILQAAAVEQRCLVTENVRGFAVLTRQADHGGVLFVHGQRWATHPHRHSPPRDRLGSSSPRNRCPTRMTPPGSPDFCVPSPHEGVGAKWEQKCSSDYLNCAQLTSTDPFYVGVSLFPQVTQ